MQKNRQVRYSNYYVILIHQSSLNQDKSMDIDIRKNFFISLSQLFSSILNITIFLIIYHLNFIIHLKCLNIVQIFILQITFSKLVHSPQECPIYDSASLPPHIKIWHHSSVSTQISAFSIFIPMAFHSNKKNTKMPYFLVL